MPLDDDTKVAFTFLPFTAVQVLNSAFETAVTELAPHVITFYLKDLASDFHSYYNDTKINVEDETLKKARLLLVFATSMIIKKSLSLLGISSPPKM